MEHQLYLIYDQALERWGIEAAEKRLRLFAIHCAQLAVEFAQLRESASQDEQHILALLQSMTLDVNAVAQIHQTARSILSRREDEWRTILRHRDPAFELTEAENRASRRMFGWRACVAASSPDPVQGAVQAERALAGVHGSLRAERAVSTFQSLCGAVQTGEPLWNPSSEGGDLQREAIQLLGSLLKPLQRLGDFDLRIVSITCARLALELVPTAPQHLREMVVAAETAFHNGQPPSENIDLAAVRSTAETTRARFSVEADSYDKQQIKTVSYLTALRDWKVADAVLACFHHSEKIAAVRGMRHTLSLYLLEEEEKVWMPLRNFATSLGSLEEPV